MGGGLTRMERAYAAEQKAQWERKRLEVLTLNS